MMATTTKTYIIPVQKKETILDYIERFLHEYTPQQQPGLTLRQQELCAHIVYYNSILKYPASQNMLMQCITIACTLMITIDEGEISEEYTLDLSSLAKESLKHVYMERL